MRLTLRTLLAYLDDILDPQDAQQLQKKIEDSEFATSLVHQIRGSVRRLRLDAPSLDAQGIGGDLNSVAEYLDNVLPPDQVPALEKACLDNEVNLGEVASCHQVLTLVLGEPADINDRMRQQAYAVAPTVESSELPPTPVTRIEAHPAHPSVPPPASPAVVAPTPTTSQPETPMVPVAKNTFQPEEVAETTSARVISKPATEKKRPSERLAESVDVPSTREAWRAEALHGLEKESQGSVPVAAIATPVVDTAATVASGASPIYPEYMDRKSSWLRSAFVTGLVALLILAGLLLATSPVDSNFFARWFGSKPTLVVDQDKTTPLQSRTVEPTQSNESIEVEVVDANQPTDWNEPDRVGIQAEQNLDSPPAFDTTFDSGINAEFPSKTAPADMEIPEHNQLPNLIAENRFDENPLDANDDASPTNDVESGGTPDSEPLPQLEPNADVTTTKDVTTGNGGLDVDQQLVNTVPDDVVVVTPNFSPKDEFPEVPPAPVGPDANITRSDGPLIPAVGNIAPLVDPGLDLEPAPISPPVASPVPNVAVTDVTTSARMPVEEPAAPEPALAPVLEPTKLSQADQLLLVFDSETDDWTRVNSTVPLEAGDFLMGMPAFRADIEIGSSMVCTMVNAARLQLGPAADLTLHDGQLLLRNGQDADTQGVRIQGERFEIEMPDSGGVVAIQASRGHIPGDDVTEVPHSLVKIYAINHNAVVQYMGRTYGIEEGHQLQVFDSFQPRIQEVSKKPQWATSTSVFAGDKNAVRTWKRDLDKSQNMRIWLQERANRRYSERALAARCLAEMDEFDAIISALNDPEQHAFWEQHFNTLRRALTRGSETIDKLQLELEKAHGERAAFMMEMIRGFSEKQLALGAAAKLVKYLDHRSLDHRVLAIQNLKSITGYSLAFQPEKSAGYRKSVVRKWKGKLSGGKVTYKETPEVRALLESFAAADQEASRQ